MTIINRMRIWKAKALLKQIVRNEEFLIKSKIYQRNAQVWLKNNHKELDKVLEEMSEEEYYGFAIKTGYLEEKK